MRELATGPRIQAFMRGLGAAATTDTKVYLTGGATAVLLGWREATIDVELASPDLFIPPFPGWETRSLFITREG